ncbi:MAG: hydrolase [Myxococcaceae bacterium]|nr:hydrolase [Myxococcaceae bacterium]
MTSNLIQSGAKGEAVSALQTKLKKLGFAVQTDGIYGPGTKGAIEELQTLFGYDVDGVVGPGTAKLIDQQLGLSFSVEDPAALKRALESNAQHAPKRVLQHGTDGPDVRLLQRKLGLLGYSVAVDGKYGPATEKAVRALQQAFGYDLDGIAGTATDKLINQQIGLGWNSSKQT